jgi:hypothetical protein
MGFSRKQIAPFNSAAERLQIAGRRSEEYDRSRISPLPKYGLHVNPVYLGHVDIRNDADTIPTASDERKLLAGEKVRARAPSERKDSGLTAVQIRHRRLWTPRVLSKSGPSPKDGVEGFIQTASRLIEYTYNLQKDCFSRQHIRI